LSAELTSSRVTFLEEIIENFFEVPAPAWWGGAKEVEWLKRETDFVQGHGAWRFSYLSMRANSELLPRGNLVMQLQSPTQQCGIVYISWLKPPQLQSWCWCLAAVTHKSVMLPSPRASLSLRFIYHVVLLIYHLMNKGYHVVLLIYQCNNLLCPPWMLRLHLCSLVFSLFMNFDY
jgi:hypothetical protein